MVRLRFFTRSPDGLRPWLTGLVIAASGTAWAAPTAVETLDSAVTRELDAIRGEAGSKPATTAKPSEPNAPRRLPEFSDSSVRPVAGQQPPQPPATRPTAPQPTAPQPTETQLEVMRQLQEMYERDGREMPSMRMKDAPNTRLPNGQRPVLVPRGGSATPTASQPASGPGTAPPAPAPNSPRRTTQIQSVSGAQSLGDREASPAPRPSFFDRLRGNTGTKSASGEKKGLGGLLGKLLSPFRKQESRSLGPQSPPVPPPLPDYGSPTDYANQPPAAQQALPASPARTLTPQRPPAAPEAFALPSMAPPVREREVNPFAEATEPQIAITPAQNHPLDDAFSAVRGETAPDLAIVEVEDPEFANAEPIEPGAPRPLDPQTVSDSEGFAEVQIEEPPAAPPQESAADRYAELQRKLAERAGLGGFQGFCPVALRDRRELADARPEFLSVYRGRTYELSSAEAKARFEANPAKYAPMSGGNDVVLVENGETEAEGNLTHAVWFKDRLYLFRSPETLRSFNAEPAKYAVAE